MIFTMVKDQTAARIYEQQYVAINYTETSAPSKKTTIVATCMLLHLFISAKSLVWIRAGKKNQKNRTDWFFNRSDWSGCSTSQ